MQITDIKASVCFASLTALLLIAGWACDNNKQKKKEEPATAETSEKEEKSITDRMAEEHEGDSPEQTGFADLEPASAVESEMVTYATVGDKRVQGYYARPSDADGPVPGIIAIHEWWGLNQNIKHVSDLLAGEGYQVLAVDLYEGKSAESPDKAKQLMSDAMGDKERLKENLSDAFNFVAEEQGAPSVGVIGWCFGGGWSLQTALMFPEKLDATVIYYGELVTDAEKLEPLTMPVVGFFGKEDSSIPPSKVEAFEKAMEKADSDITIHSYEGAGHAFANPSGQRYEPEAAMDAWNKTLEFFDEHLTASDTKDDSE